MKFREYLTRRIGGRPGPHTDGLSRLLMFPDWPEVFENWAELRDWLQQRHAQLDDYEAAERAWVSYKVFLKSVGRRRCPATRQAPCAGFPRAY